MTNPPPLSAAAETMTEEQKRLRVEIRNATWTRAWGPLTAAVAEKLCAGSADSGTPADHAGGGGAHPTRSLHHDEAVHG